MNSLSKLFDHNDPARNLALSVDPKLKDALRNAFGSTRFDFANEEHRIRLGKALVDIEWGQKR